MPLNFELRHEAPSVDAAGYPEPRDGTAALRFSCTGPCKEVSLIAWAIRRALNLNQDKQN